MDASTLHFLGTDMSRSFAYLCELSLLKKGLQYLYSKSLFSADLDSAVLQSANFFFPNFTIQFFIYLDSGDLLIILSK